MKKSLSEQPCSLYLAVKRQNGKFQTGSNLVRKCARAGGNEEGVVQMIRVKIIQGTFTTSVEGGERFRISVQSPLDRL
ncbi:hypothetical protein [Algicola sagamiensis]|uniref:hypothetical protein n=1 Tax=Algicola sagamiensis TaxID=163869 RepID=UPI0012F7CBD8|nr:hypothetical protein [Algicola sagamiensis]